jgi:anti-sigma regulatory factor (Ser/Thr protein kinase)
MANDDLGAPRTGDGPGCRRLGRRQAEFPADVSAAVAARALVREVCAAWGLWDVVDEAVLVVSELVSNAVDHARSASRVMLSLDGRRLTIAVRDSCVCEPPRPQPLKPAGTRGRGLSIVSAVSGAWGVEEHADGKTIWAVLTAPDHRG